MKRVLAGLLILVLAASGCAYAAVTGQEESAYLLYFREADLSKAPGGDALRAETVYLDEEEEQGVEQLAQALLEELLAGPVDETLVNTIPTGTTLLSLELDGARALVDLSAAYSTLSGVPEQPAVFPGNDTTLAKNKLVERLSSSHTLCRNFPCLLRPGYA